jgi:hypothetical protein
MAEHATVAAQLGLRLVIPEHAGVPLTASLYYRADDPYAIRMTFHTGAEEPVEWLFARDLLAEGLDHPAGDGDVRIWPATGDGPQILNIRLSSPSGTAHFQAPLAAFTRFLARSFEAVPSGGEEDFADIDAELSELLREA